MKEEEEKKKKEERTDRSEKEEKKEKKKEQRKNSGEKKKKESGQGNKKTCQTIILYSKEHKLFLSIPKAGHGSLDCVVTGVISKSARDIISK